jgi:hypothetical protein
MTVAGLRVVVTFVMLLGSAQVLAVAQTADSVSSAPSASTSRPLLRYTLPPDKLEKAYVLYLLNGWLYLLTTIYGILVLYLMLRTRFGVRLRDLAQRTSRFRFVQAVIVMSLFIVVLQLLQLPFDSYNHHVELKYGLSVQHWGS